MSPATSKPVGTAAVQEALATVRARIVLVVVIALLGLGGGALVGISKQDSASEYTMRVRLYPLSENTTAVTLGVNTPGGPIAADFVSDRVLQGVVDAIGDTSLDELREKLLVSGVDGDPDQMKMAAPAGVAGLTAPELLHAWLAAIQVQQHAYVAKAIADTKEGYRQDLARAHPLMKSRREDVKNLARLSGLQGSLETDVGVLREPYREAAVATRSPLFYAIAGGLAGLVAGLALALAIGLLDRRLRTAGAISAQFGLPVIADLRDEEGAGALARRLRAVEGSGASVSPVVAVEAGPAGGAAAVASALGDEVELRPAGGIWSDEAQSALRQAGSWIVVVTPGETRTNQAAEVAAEVAALSSSPLGVVLV